MYGKMQESGLTEIIPFKCMSTILEPVSCVFMQCSGFSLLWLLLWSMGSRSMDSVVVADGLTCPGACGILEQESNPCPLLWQVDS